MDTIINNQVGLVDKLNHIYVGATQRHKFEDIQFNPSTPSGVI